MPYLRRFSFAAICALSTLGCTSSTVPVLSSTDSLGGSAGADSGAAGKAGGAGASLAGHGGTGAVGGQSAAGSGAVGGTSDAGGSGGVATAGGAAGTGGAAGSGTAGASTTGGAAGTGTGGAGGAAGSEATGGAAGTGTGGAAGTGTGGAGGDQAGAAGASSYAYARFLAPQSTSTVTSQTPTLRWALGGGATGAHVNICHDRGCGHVIYSFDATGTSSAPPGPLDPGVVFWRLTPIGGNVSGGAGGAGPATPASPSWEFTVGHGSAPVDTSSGTTFDVNGDGYADVVVGAPGSSDPNNPLILGAAYVFLGSAAGLSQTPTPMLDPGSNPVDEFGLSVASAGDVDGDGYPDLVVGAPGSNTAGAAYVYFGSAAGLSPTALTLTDPALNPDDSFGASVASAGDVNGDGYADILVNASFSSESVVYLYLGGPNGPQTPPVVLHDPGMVADDGFGSVLSGAGDINGDGFSDVIIGTYVYLGSAAGLSATPTLLTYPGTNPNSRFGQAVSGAGDVNGDGYTDVLVGASGDSAAYLYLGSAAGLGAVPVSLTGGVIGSTLAGAGDINGDGFGDLVIGTAGAYTVDVFLGGAAGPSSTPVVLGVDGTNQPVAGAGDVNGDGFDDILASPGGGNAFLYPGSAAGVVTTPVTILAPADSGYFGASLQ